VSEVSFPHRPVLYKETIQYLVPSSPKHYLDCTAGAGGHSEGILIESAPSGELLALDLDPPGNRTHQAAPQSLRQSRARNASILPAKR